MKKLLYGSIAFVALVVIAAFLVWWNLPFLGSYVIGKIAGGKVAIGKVDLGYKNGILSAELGDVSIKGKVSGDAKSWKLVFNLRKGLHLNHVAVSDFNLEISDLIGKKKEYYIVPTDLLEARNGVVTLAGESFVVKELVAEHLKMGHPFTYHVDVRNDEMFGELKAKGDGVLKGKATTLKGRASVIHMDMGRWTGKMSGLVNGESGFVFAKGKLSIDGSFEVAAYELKIPELKKQHFNEILKGHAFVVVSGDTIDVHVKDVLYKGTKFQVNVKVEKEDVTEVRLSSGVLDLVHVRDHVDLEKIAEGGSQIWEYVKDGSVELKKLSYSLNRPFDVDVKVTGVRAEYEDKTFTGIEGFLRFDEKKVEISGAKGNFKESVFQDVSGVVTFSNKYVTAKGAYTVNLKDIASELQYDDLAVKGGIAEGTAALERGKGGVLDWSGIGSLRDGEVFWKNMPFSAKGAYSFTKDAITLNPLEVLGGGTNVALRGTWSKNSMEFGMKGRLDAGHVKRVLPLPFKVDGTATVNVQIESKDEAMKAGGSLDLKDVSYEITDVMKKGKGVSNTVSFDVSKGDKGVDIRRLKYDLEAIDLTLSGAVGNDRKMDLDVAMKIDGFERVAGLFSVTDVKAKGNADVKLTMREVDLKTGKIPYIKGYIDIDNGVVRLPWVTRPFTEIKLRADFMGDAFDVNIEKVKCGSSLLRKGTLHAESLESPRFNLALDMENFSLSDFEDESEFNVSSLHRDALLARASGSISLKAVKASLGHITGENLEIAAFLADRKITVSEFRVGALGGKADLHGNIDFSASVPRFNASGKINGITADRIVKSFDPESQIVEGTGLISGNISSGGGKPKDWLRNMDGEMIVYSRNGVIRKWSLLAKIFGILNIYDLLKGRVDLRADGLAYTKMSASFNIKKGLFRTDNFIIDSPSMLITGSGDFDFVKKTVVGDVTVSPLVAVDSVIDRLPIIRTILNQKKGGFLYSSYEVSGTLGDPEVKLRFVDTIGGKSLNIIKNILTLPIGVFE
jgi:hypothetical protein